MEDKHIKIFSDTSVVVSGLRSLLEENNIGCIVKDQTESGRLAGFGTPINSVEIYILESDWKQAKPVLEKFKKEIGR